MIVIIDVFLSEQRVGVFVAIATKYIKVGNQDSNVVIMLDANALSSFS